MEQKVHSTTWWFFVLVMSFFLTVGSISNISAQIATIGTGTDTNADTGPAPINIYYRSIRTQTVYTVSELDDAGITGENDIIALAYYITEQPLYPLPNFRIRMRHTSAADASEHITAPYQEVYLNPSYLPVTGDWNILYFNSPFVWNGVDNILIDTAFAQVPNFDNTGQQMIFDAPNGMSYARSDGADQTSTVTDTTVHYKPQLQLHYVPTGFYENDLAVQTITGPSELFQGIAGTFALRVRNMGTNAQSNFTVRLMLESDIELASTIVTSQLEQYEAVTVNLPWTATLAEEGEYSVWGEVDLTGDENPANDTTEPLPVVVIPAWMNAIHIGEARTRSINMPLNFFFRNSVTQTIYMADEINQDECSIMKIAYYNDFLGSLTDKPVRIWMGNTTLSDLTQGWVNAGDLELVFDGELNFPHAENTIFIDLESTFTYTGDNLIIMAERPMDLNYYTSSDFFYYTDTPEYPDRSRYARNDTADNPLDPYNMSDGLGPSSEAPNITLFIEGTAPVLPVPLNLIATVDDKTVSLEWEAPEMPELRSNSSIWLEQLSLSSRYTPIELAGYNIYRDYEMINLDLVEDTYYLDPDLESGIYVYYITGVYNLGESDPGAEIEVIVGVNVEEVTTAPFVTVLEKNYPNPFNPETTINFSLREPGLVIVEVFNSRGQRVKTLINEIKEAGKHRIVWNGRDENDREVSSGMYFYRMKSRDYSAAKKMILLK